MLEPADLDALLSSKTRLLVFPHCSNVVGHINPIPQIAAKAHAAGALVLVDGVAGAPHGFPDIPTCGADLYLFSLYKTFGPHQGLMVVRREILDQLTNQSHYFNDEFPRKKLIPAGPDHAQVAAASGIADYFDAVYNHHFEKHGNDNGDVANAEKGRKLHQLFRSAEMARIAPLLDWLDARQDVTLIGPVDAATHAPTVAIQTHSHSAAFVARELAEHNVMVGSGHFYAVRVLEGMNYTLGSRRAAYVVCSLHQRRGDQSVDWGVGCGTLVAQQDFVTQYSVFCKVKEGVCVFHVCCPL